MKKRTKKEYLPEVPKAKKKKPAKPDSSYLDYGGGGDPWHNENSGPHNRYGG
jgi:hypothetical protein